MDTTLGMLGDVTEHFASEIRSHIFKEKHTRYDKVVISCAQMGKEIPLARIAHHDDTFYVPSTSVPGQYFSVVQSASDSWSCACDWFDASRRLPATAARTCKHIGAVRYHFFNVDNSMRSPSFSQWMMDCLEPYMDNRRTQQSSHETTAVVPVPSTLSAQGAKAKGLLAELLAVVDRCTSVSNDIDASKSIQFLASVCSQTNEMLTAYAGELLC